MANFEVAIQKTLIKEGGYVNDKDDLGGETYKGISRKANPKWEGWIYVDRLKDNKDFPEVLEKNGTLQAFVKDLYLNNYWKPLMAQEFKSQALADSIFDFAVNVGVNTCIAYVQEVIDANIDGIIGANTLYLLNNYDEKLFLAEFKLIKVRHYLDVVKKKPTSIKYLDGWLRKRALGS